VSAARKTIVYHDCDRPQTPRQAKDDELREPGPHQTSGPLASAISLSNCGTGVLSRRTIRDRHIHRNLEPALAGVLTQKTFVAPLQA